MNLMGFTALVSCLFVLLCQAKGDVKEETLYVETGTDLLLDVRKPVTLKEHEHMVWKFQSEVNIIKLTQTNKTIPLGNYTGRAEVFPQNQSLLLKNVQKTDSGGYRAEFVGFEVRVLAQYQVRVVDPVSDVKLEVKQCSSDRSNLTVTCTTLDALLNSTFICENTTCSHEGGEPVLNIPPGASLKVYLKNGSVTCHHSNQVSSTEDTKAIEDLCRRDSVNSASTVDPSNIYVSISVIVVIILVVVCGAAVYYRHCRKQGETEGGEDPVYDDVTTDLQRDLNLTMGPRNDAQFDSPELIYSRITKHRAAPTEAPAEPIIEIPTESYYATVKKTAKSRAI